MRGDPMGPSPKRGLRVGVLVVTLLGTSAVRASSSSPPSPAPVTAPVTALLSVASNGAHGDADSFAPSLSADGSTVAFSSLATNLAAPEPVEVVHQVNVFVRDQRTGRTVRVSEAPDGTAADGDSGNASLPADGSAVAFESSASNLVPGDTNGAPDIFVRDRVSGRTTRVSVDSSGAQANEGSFTPSISADGRFVAFASDATALVPGDHNRHEDVFAHDRRPGRTSPA